MGNSTTLSSSRGITSIPIFTDLIPALMAMDNESLGNFTRQLCDYAINGTEPDVASLEGILVSSTRTVIDNNIARQIKNWERQQKKAGPEASKECEEVSTNQGLMENHVDSHMENRVDDPIGIGISNGKGTGIGSGIDTGIENVKAASKQQPELSLVVDTHAHPVPKRAPKPAKPEQQQAAMQSYVQENGLGYLQKAVGAAAFEDMVRSREYNPFEAQLEKAQEEEAELDASFDPEADKKYDASLVTPSSILPCMTHAQINPENGALWSYPDANHKKHYTPLGGILADYHQRTGKTDYSSFQRSIKVNCPANCQGTQKQMHQCWDCVHKALDKWDKTKSPTPHRLIGKIIQDERGF